MNFHSPDWKELEERVRGERDSDVVALKNPHLDMHMTQYYRGRVEFAEFLLDLPNETTELEAK